MAVALAGRERGREQGMACKLHTRVCVCVCLDYTISRGSSSSGSAFHSQRQLFFSFLFFSLFFEFLTLFACSDARATASGGCKGGRAAIASHFRQRLFRFCCCCFFRPLSVYAAFLSLCTVLSVFSFFSFPSLSLSLFHILLSSLFISFAFLCIFFYEVRAAKMTAGQGVRGGCLLPFWQNSRQLKVKISIYKKKRKKKKLCDEMCR